MVLKGQKQRHPALLSFPQPSRLDENGAPFDHSLFPSIPRNRGEKNITLAKADSLIFCFIIIPGGGMQAHSRHAALDVQPNPKPYQFCRFL